MEIPDPVSASYGSRFCFKENSQSFFPFGNTPAKDLLEFARPGWREPLVLLLGFDDLRSVFYTIWKNFHPDFYHRFEGLHFTLSDNSPAVLARNLLLLYLCIKLPKDTSSRQKWLSAMWSIWFCHELLPDHERILRSALKVLLLFADDWSSSDNPLHWFIRFSSPTALRGVKKFWSLWSNNKAIDSSKVLKNLRQKELARLRGGIAAEASIGLFDLTGTMGTTLHRDLMDVMREDYRAYLEVGSVYIEELFGRALAPAKKRTVNVTMFEHFGEYRIYYTQCPYRCFHQVHICSMKTMMSVRMHVTDYDQKNCDIAEEVFQKRPLLANSFQQFSLWTICSSEVLLSRRNKVKFCFSLMDAFQLSQSPEHQYDLVYASNIVDHLAPPALIMACSKLMKDDGRFLCGSILHKEFASTLEGYLEANFGFSCKFLPVLCGLRCINHEGKGYSSAISTDHLCVDPGDADPKQSSMRERVLIWEKVDMTLLTITSLTDIPELSQALADCFNFCCTPLTRTPTGRNLSNLLCTGTAMEVLQSFASRLDASVASSYSFWTPLCTDIKRREGMNLFLSSIQTQALLRGIHLHVTVDSASCPICKDTPLSEYLGQFFMEIPVEKVSTSLPIITIFISQKRLDVSDFESDLMFLFAFTKLMQEDSAHNVDCITAEVKGEYLQISFLAPRHLSRPGYSFTLNEFILIQGVGGRIRNRTNVLRHGNIRNHLVGRSLSFKSKICSPQLVAQTYSLGTIVKHVGSGDFFETTLSLAEDKPELLTEKLSVKQVSSRKIETTCAGHSFLVVYPYPVAYGKVSLQRSKKTKTLTLKAYRRPHEYVEDTQLFHVNPEDHFTFPSLLPNSKSLELFSQKQFATKLKIFKPSTTDLPFLAVEQCIKAMITLTDQILFFMISEHDDEKVYGVFEILHRAVDVHRKVPVIHLFLCFVETLPEEKVSLMASLMGPQCEKRKENVTRLQIAKESFSLIEIVFRNFAAHTIQSLHLRPRYIPDMVLPIGGNSCRQAVIYPLYEEPCRAAVDLRCGNCASILTNKVMHKCVCKEVWYCTLECQEKHAKVHSKVCNGPQVNPDNFISKEHCSYCRKKSDSLKSCSNCRQTVYCGRECQRSHWKVAHRFDCPRLQAAEKEKAKCSICLQTATGDLLKCTVCDTVSYCSKPCLERHLGMHNTETPDSAPQTDEALPAQASPAEEQKPLPSQSDMPKSEPTEETASAKAKKKHSSKPTSKEKAGVKLGPCGYCGKKPSKPHRCARCHKVLYCDSECQKAHWKEHKIVCKSSS